MTYQSTKIEWYTHFYSLIWLHDNRDKNREYDVDEETDKTVEVDATVEPNIRWFVAHYRECCIHVVPVHQREETFRCRGQTAELKCKMKFHLLPWKQNTDNVILIETERSSCWWVLHHWLHRRLPTWQPPVQQVCIMTHQYHRAGTFVYVCLGKIRVE